MDSLPNELMWFIFEHLEPKWLVSCRYVSKRFKHHADEARVRMLIVADECSANTRKTWFTSKEMIDIRNHAIRPTSFNAYKMIFNLESHLRRLSLNFDDDLQFNLSVLDGMPIEQLDVRCGRIGYTKSNHSIKLPNLKTLEFFANSDLQVHYVFVQAPKLLKM